MKYIHAMRAVVCLLVVGGAIGAARAHDQDEEHKGVTLYTPVNIGDFHRCMAVNVSDKPLSIIIELITLKLRRCPATAPTLAQTRAVRSPPLTRPLSFRSFRAQAKLYRLD